MQPVIRHHQHAALGNDVADAQALFPFETQGGRDVATQRDGVDQARRQGEHVDDVAIGQRARQSDRVERQFFDDAILAIEDALQRDFLPGRAGRESAGHGDQFSKLLVFLQFVNAGDVDTTTDRRQGADRWHEDHVAGKKLRVAGLVALQQQVVEIEFRDDLVAALELNLAQRTLGGRAARCQQRVDEGRERADRVAAGLTHLADDEHLDRTQLAERHHQVEIPEHARYRTAHAGVKILIAGRGDVDGPDLRDVDAAIAIHRGAHVDIDLSPGADQDLVPRTDDVIGRHRHPVQRRKRGERTVEQVVAEHRQVTPGRLEHEFLELVALQRRRETNLFTGGSGLTFRRRLGEDFVGARRDLGRDDGGRLNGERLRRLVGGGIEPQLLSLARHLLRRQHLGKQHSRDEREMPCPCSEFHRTHPRQSIDFRIFFNGGSIALNAGEGERGK